MPDDIAIEVKDLHKSFILPHEKVSSVKSVFTNLGFAKNKNNEKQDALKGVSFTVKKGEFFGIVGRNGSGKSTLLKLLAGIYQPTKGSIETNGKIVPFIELGVGFNPELSGRDNVYLNGAMLGFSDKEVDKKYETIVDFAELERFMDQKLKNYSSGMQVRLAFSVATILAESDILLLDEVLAVGDADFQRKCFSYFKTLKKLKKTVIFISHDMNAIREYCTSAVLIDKGIIQVSGKSEDVAKEYTKLFDDNIDKANNSKSKPDKWGSGGVNILSVESPRNFSDKDDFIKIKVLVKAENNFPEGLIAGITIKNEADQPVCGTNTKILRKKPPAIMKDKTISFVWKIPNIFNEGEYTVEPAIADPATVSILQWWDNAHVFKVKNEYKTPYITAPAIDISFEKK